jgi:hypothetical protein
MSGMTSPSYNQDFFLDIVQITQELLSDIILDIQSIPEFSVENETQWNQKVLRVTENVSRFVEITTLIGRALSIRKKISVPEIKQCHIHMLFVLKAINQTQINKDFTALEDLIKYELKDNLTQWKIDLIPQIKKHLTA